VTHYSREGRASGFNVTSLLLLAGVELLYCIICVLRASVDCIEDQESNNMHTATMQQCIIFVNNKTQFLKRNVDILLE